MSKNDKKRKLLIGVISGAILLVIIIFLLWFFNRKFDITLDYNDGTKTKIVQIKYNKAINKKDIENTDGLNATWYEVVEKKENEEILAKEPFDFKTKINKNIKLKAIYDVTSENEDTKKITISFDSKGGSKVQSITLNKGKKLTLPKSPTLNGYTFKGWTDKNGKPIYNGALLAESTTLYANWEKIKEEDKKSNNVTDNKTQPVTYYCDSDFTLSDKKCIKVDTVKANGKCPIGYKGGAWNSEYCYDEVDPYYYCDDYAGYNGDDAKLDEDNNMCYYNLIYTTDKGSCDVSSGRLYYDHGCYAAKTPAVLGCSKGEPLNSSGMCDIKINKIFTCPSGYELDNATKYCSKTITIDAKQK